MLTTVIVSQPGVAEPQEEREEQQYILIIVFAPPSDKTSLEPTVQWLMEPMDKVSRKVFFFKFQGFRQFDFIPQSFMIPSEFQDFCGKL